MLVTHIDKIVQVGEKPCPPFRAGTQMRQLPCLDQAFLLTKGDTIEAFGPMADMENSIPPERMAGEERIDASGGMLFPSFCDCHSHLVYAGSREKEFIDKILGFSYEEIARRGGGILNSADLLHRTSEDDLYRQARVRAKEVMAQGTGAIEIKSGYGLTVDDELKILRVIRRLARETDLSIKATFLGAHAFPEAYKNNHRGYVDLIVGQMIPRVAEEGLAQYVDVFCERGFFSVEDTSRIFEAGLRYGLRPKVHANQMDYSGGIQTGVKYGAISVDHLEHTGKAEIDCLLAAKGKTMPVLLPGATFFLGMDYAPARAMIDAGLPVALASNYNPGSCPAGDMKFMMTLACLKTGLSPQEAINAATLNGACAMDLSETHGSIAVGKRANFFITQPIPSYEYLIYAFTSPLIRQVVLNGKLIPL